MGILRRFKRWMNSHMAKHPTLYVLPGRTKPQSPCWTPLAFLTIQQGVPCGQALPKHKSIKPTSGTLPTNLPIHLKPQLNSEIQLALILREHTSWVNSHTVECPTLLVLHSGTKPGPTPNFLGFSTSHQARLPQNASPSSGTIKQLGTPHLKGESLLKYWGDKEFSVTLRGLRERTMRANQERKPREQT